MGLNYQTTIIGAVVALVMFMGIVVTILSVTGSLDEKSTPLLVTVFGAVASTIAALLAVLRADRAVTLIHKTNGDVNDLTRRMEVSDPGGARKSEGDNAPGI